MNTKLVGLKAQKQNGKDTVADYLVKNYQFQKYAFADPLKKGVMEMFGFTHEQMWGSAEEKETIDPRWNISPRKMLMLVGTELFQYDIHKYLKKGEFDFGRTIWVQRFKLWYKGAKKMNESNNLKFNVVISDLRFPHEANAIVGMGGEIWEIIRPNMINNDSHASEAEMKLINPNKVITNDGTLENLYEKIDMLIYNS